MEKINSPLFFYSLIFTSCLGSLSAGYQFGIYNTCSGAILEFYSLSLDENKQLYEGLITSSISLGGIIGAFYSSSLIRVGRRTSLMLTDIFSIVSIFFIYFPGIFSLIFSRLLSGICLGFNSVIVPIFIKEFSPMEISGTTGSFHSVLGSAGVMLSFIFGFLMPYVAVDGYGISFWKILFSFPIIFSLTRIYLLMRYFTFETPSFLWKKKREYEAKSVMEMLYSEEQSFEFIKSFQKTNAITLHYAALFAPDYINQMKFGIVISMFQQLSGINALIFYSNQIFLQDGNETIAVVFTFLIGILLTITAVISGKFMDYFGRRKAMLFGDFFAVCSLGLMVILKPTSLSFLNKYVILLFVFTYGVSLGPILWVYLTETLPEKGVSLATLINWVTCLLVSFIFPKMLNSFLKFEGTFSFFFFCGVIGLIFIYLYMIETKGRSAAEISKMCQYDMEEKPHLILDNSTSSKITQKE